MIKSNSQLIINKKNLKFNYHKLSKISKNSITAATIKANAYGLGDIEVCKLLKKNGCNHFFLATTEEAIRVRNIFKKINIYVLNGLESNPIKIFNKYNLIPILNSKEELNLLTKNINSKFKFGLHIETGLNRLGLNLLDSSNNLYKKLNLEILISHLASAEELNNKYNKLQNLNFTESFKIFNKIRYKSLCSSAGIMNNNFFHHDMVRPGISLFGGYDNINLEKKFKIKPVIKLRGKILQIKTINKNEYVGYNQTYKTKQKTKIAIIGIGYADGISRMLSNNGKLFYKKDIYKIIGRVSMDSVTVNINKSQYKLKIGEYMEVINEQYTIEKMAKKCKTISNEILTSISSRVKRIYI